MSLYFGNSVATITTLLVASIFVYIVFTLSKQSKIKKWGKRVAILAVWGLVICCFVAVRDGYHLSVQASMDSNITSGIFTLNSIQSKLCCVGGAIIAFSSLSSIFIRNQNYWRIMFMIISAIMLLKTFVIEFSRILL